MIIRVELLGVQNEIFSRRNGDISSAICLKSSNGNKYFLKFNFDQKDEILFRGEFEGLRLMKETNSGLVIPEVFCYNKHAMLMEYLEFGKFSEEEFGVYLANMHLSNRKSSNPVTQFGFHVTTCCGEMAYPNEWNLSWEDFYFDNRLKFVIERINNKELFDLFEKLKNVKHQIFVGADPFPSLVHGDLWSGNYSGVGGKPAIYDPGAFYGDDEFEFGMIDLFGSVGDDFYKGYRSVIPERNGFNRRVKLYKLFHLLNHWAHFGSSYKNSSLSCIQNILQYTDDRQMQ